MLIQILMPAKQFSHSDTKWQRQARQLELPEYAVIFFDGLQAKALAAQNAANKEKNTRDLAKMEMENESCSNADDTTTTQT